MKLDEFKEKTVSAYEQTLRRFEHRIVSGQITLQEQHAAKSQVYYPNVALFVETENHLICELFGSQTNFTGLRVKSHAQASTESYFGQFDVQSTGTLVLSISHPQSCVTFQGVVMARELDMEAARVRLHLDHSRFTNFRTPQGTGSVVNFGVDSGTCVLDDCVIVNRLNEFYRIKCISHLLIVSKRGSLTIPSLDEKPGMILSFGCHVQNEDTLPDLRLADQFTNMFLIPSLRETTLGEFLRLNPVFLQRALFCDSFIYEPSLEWMAGNPDPAERFINPDLLVRRNDGFYDICDLKTPLLNRRNVTKGAHRRRRFIDDIQEGLAQLANYRAYFQVPENAQYAKDRFGIEVRDPQLTLIVGNYENVAEQEITEAARMLGEDTVFRIIDFDTLSAMYIKSGPNGKCST